MTKHIALILAAAAAACGSRPPTPTNPPVAAVPDSADHEHAGAAGETPPPAHDDGDHEHGGSAGETPAPALPATSHAASGKAELLANERIAWDTAKPVFDRACASCHTTTGKKAAKKKLDHFNMDTYPLGGHHTQTIGFTIRDVLGISGKKPTMPFGKPGSVQGQDLAKVKAWTDAWETAEQAGAHPTVGVKHDDD
jgi:mono/diheme cytochrome c family protein